MKRRDFLRHMAVMPILSRSCLASVPMIAGMKNAFAANGKSLIIIFQRGGCDGLNTVIPYAEDEYYRLRPDIAISPPSSHADSALDLNDNFFGLHPSLRGLYNIFQQGNLAILPTVHYNDANRSHFSSQNFIESGVPNQTLNSGWLNRYLASTTHTSDIPAISFSTLAHSLQGTNPVVTVKNLSSISESINNSQRDNLINIFNQSVNNENHARSLLHKHGALALNSISTLDSVTTSNYPVENGAIYPDTLYGQQLKDIAQLIKSDIGLEVATVSSNDWDHHANQGGSQGTHASKLLEFSSGIEALYTDLGSALMGDVTILTISEFGRTAKQNASKGTDHGNASTWFVIGGQVNGGIYGQWPGLLPSQLYEERYLAHTIDFTDVYTELLTRHLDGANSIPSILPGSHYQSIGFLT